MLEKSSKNVENRYAGVEHYCLLWQEVLINATSFCQDHLRYRNKKLFGWGLAQTL